MWWNSTPTPPAPSSPPCSSSSSSGTADIEEEHAFSIESYRDYVSTKVLLATATGSAIGVSSGYYIGDMMALYGYSYALGFGFGSTAYFSGTYVLKNLRKRDDYINHGLSGFFNGAWMVTAFGGVRKGVFGAIGAYASMHSIIIF